MNLIDDLGNDLALAFLVEKKYDRKINRQESLALIGRIKETLRPVALAETEKRASVPLLKTLGIPAG